MQYTEILLTTKQKNMDTYKEVIYEFPYDTSTDIMEYCLKKNLDERNSKYLNEINDIGVDGKGWETKDIEYEYVIHRDINENEQENICDTLKKVIEECPDDQYDEKK